jgi:hypothetical protein
MLCHDLDLSKKVLLPGLPKKRNLFSTVEIRDIWAQTMNDILQPPLPLPTSTLYHDLNPGPEDGHS